ncbi:MAG: hypothetical protein WBX25_37345 [Rhodomicrobium sp.]
MSEQQKPWVEMREELRRRLYERELEAFGIMAAPELRDDFEKISAAIFHKPEFDWKENAVSSMHYKYVCVKVGLPSKCPYLEVNTTNVELLSSEPGRPSKAQERDDAIYGLLKEGVDLKAMKRKDACERVRQYAQEKLKANVTIGYDNETIQPHLVRILGKRK